MSGKVVWKLRVSFTTPAFLGGADQSGQWRTPPFKALLRQWWRVVHAAKKDFRVSPAMLRSDERALFGGSAGDAGTRSRVCLRLDWRGGTKPSKEWPHKSFQDQYHPEMDTKDPKKRSQRPKTDLYLFYGVVNQGRVQRRSYLGEGRTRDWLLTIPGEKRNEFEEALLLAGWFGTLGGRSRNGSGSLALASAQGRQSWDVDWDDALDPANRSARDGLRGMARDWREALGLDWIHAVGKDEQGLLLWRTREAFQHWTQALDVLAKIKIAYRTMFHFRGGGRRPHPVMCDRHVLAYPITNHRLFNWQANQPRRGEQEARLANQIVMKVHRLADGRYVGLIAHLPHGLPAPLRRRLSEEDQRALSARERNVWRKVHQALDGKLDGSGEIRLEGVKLGKLLQRLG